jgi:flavin-dependent dehydrogenase
MNPKYDAIIIGGGPAGATAAFFLGQTGRGVLVLEKETLPRCKTCGGAVSERILQQFPFSFDPVIESQVKVLSCALGERVVAVPLRDSDLPMVMGDKFDAFLLQHAQAKIRAGPGGQGRGEGRNSRY